MRSLKPNIILLYLLSAGGLLIGLVFYLIFKRNALITQLISNILPLYTLQNNYTLSETEFIKNHFADFLWALSFDGFIHIILMPGYKGSTACTLSVIFIGVCFELAQKFNIVNGTADPLDVLAYISGCIVVNIIYLKKKRSTNR